MSTEHKRAPIGVYDSGIGGITVLRALQAKLPHEEFIYFADTANLPYGDKSKEQITSFSHEIINWLYNKMGAKLVVAACNTSSALALPEISQQFVVPVIGTIYPLLRAVLNSTKYQKLGVIATQASANSGIHAEILRNNGFKGEVVSIGCPGFVPLIEANPIDYDSLRKLAIDYLLPFKTHRLDTLVYGCTHYPFIKEVIEQTLPKEINYIDPAKYIALEAEKTLRQNGSFNDLISVSKVRFYCSKNPEELAYKLEQLGGIKNAAVSLVSFHSSIC